MFEIMTTCDLMYEAHRAKVAEITRSGYQWSAPETSGDLRRTIAAALAALAARLDPATFALDLGKQPIGGAPA
jgi:hypothetical protein